MPVRRASLLVPLFVGITCRSAIAQCTPQWDERSFQPAGTNSSVFCSIAFDDGSGPALFIGGDFDTAGGVASQGVAKWNGSYWSKVANSETRTGRAFAVYDDGSGPALFVAGVFYIPGGENRYLAKWDGTSWSYPAGGYLNDYTRCIAVYDDGTGAALYLGGNFTQAGGTSVSHIAKWKNGVWSALGSGLDGSAQAMAVFDDGTGTALYVGGYFSTAGGQPIKGVARWKNGAWSSLGTGINGNAISLAAFQSKLYASGKFTLAGGHATTDIAGWDGSDWSIPGGGIPVASGTGGQIASGTVGGVPALFVTGSWNQQSGTDSNNVLGWDGSAWFALSSGINTLATVYHANVCDFGEGPYLVVGGQFSSASGVRANNITFWNGSKWQSTGGGLRSGSGGAKTLMTYFDGVDLNVLAAGNITGAGRDIALGIAAWRGGRWHPMGEGFRDGSGLGAPVRSLVLYDDGTGESLYAGGGFTTSGGTSMIGVARWDGVAWQPVGSSQTWKDIEALTVFDDGSGPALIVAGVMDQADASTPAKNIAKWNGTSWSAMGAGFDRTVKDLAVYDYGNGPELYATGDFYQSGTTPIRGLAKWTGSGWTDVAGSITATGGWSSTKLHVIDDGNGPILYLTGHFSQVGGISVFQIAKWNGSFWSAMSPDIYHGTSTLVSDVAWADVGDGSSLYVAGTSVINAAHGGVARLRNGQWEVPDNGVSGNVAACLLVVPNNTTSSYGLFVAGGFGYAGNAATSENISVLQGCPIPGALCFSDFDYNGFVNGGDFDAFITAFEYGLSGADVDGNGYVTGEDFDTFVEHFVEGC